MTRGLSATNQTEIDSNSLHVVLLVKLEFDTPIYVHSGIGTITYDGNSYLGVGDFGAVSQVEESESINASSFELTLSGVDATLISEALTSGRYGDTVTVYEGYRDDTGALVDDPWIVTRGKYEHASINLGAQNAVTITVRHDLAWLDEKHGARFTDEDQKVTYASDDGFEYVTDVINAKPIWGGKPITGAVSGSRGGGGAPTDQQRH